MLEATRKRHTNNVQEAHFMGPPEKIKKLIVTAKSLQEKLGLRRKAQVVIEYDPERVTPERVNEAISNFVRVLGTSLSAIRLLSVRTESIILEMGLPSHIIPRLRQLLHSNSASLRLLGVKKVVIDPEREMREEWNLAEGRYRLSVFHLG